MMTTSGSMCPSGQPLVPLDCSAVNDTVTVSTTFIEPISIEYALMPQSCWRTSAWHHLRGMKLYTAKWRGDSRGWKLDDPWSYRYFEARQELRIRDIHIHQ